MYISDSSHQTANDNELFCLLDSSSMLDTMQEYAAQMQRYNAGIQAIKTKLEILDTEFSTRYEYNPIHHIESRLKTPRSILEKLQRKHLPISMTAIRTGLTDVAGVRVICNYIDDVYHGFPTCSPDRAIFVSFPAGTTFSSQRKTATAVCIW